MPFKGYLQQITTATLCAWTHHQRSPRTQPQLQAWTTSHPMWYIRLHLWVHSPRSKRFVDQAQGARAKPPRRRCCSCINATLVVYEDCSKTLSALNTLAVFEV